MARDPATESAFARLGRGIHRRPKATLAASGVVLLLTVVALAQGGTLLPFQFPADTESGRGHQAIQDELPTFADAQFTLVFESASLHTTDAGFRDALLAAVEPLRHDARVKEVRTPYDNVTGAEALADARDVRHALVLVTLDGTSDEARAYYGELRAKVASPTMRIWATDDVAITHDFDTILEKDLQKAETASLPLTLLLLLLVFGAVVAALLPLAVGLLAVLGGVAGALALSHVTDVSIYALNIVTLIGLGVSIDYSLFIVKRFAEEQARGRSVEESLARTLATAGRAVAFSGLTVAVGLSGLLFYSGMMFATMGLAGAIVVLLAVFYALTLLPALLALLGPRVQKWPVRRKPRGPERSDAWHRFAHGVMRRPVAALAPALVVLLVAGAPFLSLEMASSGVGALPATAESRIGDELVKAQFPEQGANRISVVVQYAQGAPLTAERVGHLYDLSREIARIPGVTRVESIVDLDPRLGRADYQRLLTDLANAPEPLRRAVERSVGPHIVVLSLVNPDDATSVEAGRVVATLRAHERDRVPGATVLVTGFTAVDIDILQRVQEKTPLAIAFILAATYVLLLVQTASVVLPLKAVLMNLLSITASFGALTWVFQQGHLSGLLGFTPAPLDPSVPILLFCIVFGLSMDYEVLMLSRMQEERLKGRTNTDAVAEGLARSASLITGAAAIMVVVFAAFVLASVSFIKAVGFGLALAVAVDATIVRALVVPATMRLMGDANWWAPAWLARRLTPHVEGDDTPSTPPRPATTQETPRNLDGLPRATVRKLTFR